MPNTLNLTSQVRCAMFSNGGRTPNITHNIMNTKFWDTGNWPLTASLAEWGRILDISNVTMQKYFRTGKLKGYKKLNGVAVVSKEAVISCFRIQTANQPVTAGKK